MSAEFVFLFTFYPGCRWIRLVADLSSDAGENPSMKPIKAKKIKFGSFKTMGTLHVPFNL